MGCALWVCQIVSLETNLEYLTINNVKIILLYVCQSCLCHPLACRSHLLDCCLWGCDQNQPNSPG